MSGFFEEFMGSYNPFDSAGYDEQVIMRNSLFAVVPKIVKNELTQMQRICFEMFYFEKKNQKQIAAVLHISQPSVCRHLKSAKMIIEKSLLALRARLAAKKAREATRRKRQMNSGKNYNKRTNEAIPTAPLLCERLIRLRLF